MDDAIAVALGEAFPDRDVDDVSPAGPSWNPRNRTARVEFADGRAVFLKVAVDGDGSRIARERAAIAYVGANCDVRVPTIAASDADGPVPHLATAPLSREGLWRLWSEGNEADRAAMARRVGAALAAIHDRRFPTHGRVGGGDAEGLDLDAGSWTDVLLDTIAETRAIAPSEHFDHHFDEVVAAVEANRALLDDAPAALLHGDPATPNCFLGDEGVGFVDWELAHVGDPIRDLHRARDQLIDSLRTSGPERLATALHEGYRERAGGLPPGFDDRRPVYAAVRFLGRSGFFEKWVEFADESAEELADWVDVEMERRLVEL